MGKPYLTVIIPTYNRAEKLDNSLAHLFAQDLAHESYEVIVVDDGSMDETDKVLKAWEDKWSQLRTLHQSNSGQATARNRAIKKAEGQIILICQDDIYAAPNYLKNHVEFHQANPEPFQACLGLTQWWTELEITPYMRWLTHNGPQFAYNKLSANNSVDFWFFYTSNISLKSEVLKENLFDEDFQSYGWEDIELGYRLMGKGLELTYKPEALAWHDHAMTPESLQKRMNSIGQGAPLLESKCPGLKVSPNGLKLIILNLIGNRLVTSFLALLSPFGYVFKSAHWYALSKRYFLQGIRSL
ncbi:MAG: glycosyltransferase involved in cell wall biosynthesis [Oceanicoccus sp.]|jgi:glycosyltransferase involved in cell wall biosynthesis